jgi:hypothetical protein
MRKTHDVVCARDGFTMVPFAMESYDARNKHAQKLLLMLAVGGALYSNTCTVVTALASFGFVQLTV